LIVLDYSLMNFIIIHLFKISYFYYFGVDGSGDGIAQPLGETKTLYY
jgi:hypothetical protein